MDLFLIYLIMKNIKYPIVCAKCNCIIDKDMQLPECTNCGCLQFTEIIDYEKSFIKN